MGISATAASKSTIAPYRDSIMAGVAIAASPPNGRLTIFLVSKDPVVVILAVLESIWDHIEPLIG